MRKYFTHVLVGMLFAGLLTLQSCAKDYSGDIDDVRKEVGEVRNDVAGLKGELAKIQASVKGGAVITQVKPIENGIEVTLSNGDKHIITNGKDGKNGVDGKDGKNGVDGKDGKNGVDGKDGQNGVDGKDGKNGVDGKDGKDGVDGKDGKDGVDGKNGTVYTIGENGNWFKDGVDTGLPSRGANGKDGQNGVDGKDGKDGVYYVPGEDGYWYKYEVIDGKEVKTKGKMWKNPNGITATLENGVLIIANVQGVEGGIVKLGVVTLNNLIVIPSYVADRGGALPVVDFSPLRACEDIVPAMDVKFRISPSNVTWSETVESIRFIYNAPQVALRSADPKVEVTNSFVKDGILTVSFRADTKVLQNTLDEGKANQVQLAVKLKNGGEVFSDWVQLTGNGIIEKSELSLARRLKPDKNDATLVLPTKLADAKAINANDHRVIEVVAGKTIELSPLVEIYKDLQDFYNIDNKDNKYGLKFNFDLLDENGKVFKYELGENKTDQQQFIEKVKDTEDVFKTRVYSLDGNLAAVGRTPIVRVTVTSTAPGLKDPKCTIVLGFVKLKIVKEDSPAAEVTSYTYVADPINNVCDNAIDLVTIFTQEMNEKYYHVANLSKENFHTLYTLRAKPEVAAKNVGAVKEVEDPNDPTSYNIKWSITGAEALANVGKEISYIAQYVDAAGDVAFEMTFKTKVVRPIFNAHAYKIKDYWFYNGEGVRHNVAVPSVNATNPDDCTFITNINNAFVNKDHHLDIDLDKFQYQYKFAEKQDRMNSKDKNYKFTVSADGKSLLASKKGAQPVVIAKITDFAQSSGMGDMLEVLDTELGKEILNTEADFFEARLQLVVETCLPLDVTGLGGKEGDEFDVHFLRPINASPVSNDGFVDAVDFGTEKTMLDVKLMASLFDWRNGIKKGDFSFKTNKNYYQYYGVKTIVPNIDKISVEGLEDGAGKPITKLPSTVKVGYANADNVDALGFTQDVLNNFKERLAKPEGEFGILYYNNNGNNLADDFTLIVPVTIEYKWGKIVNTMIRVPVSETMNK